MKVTTLVSTPKPAPATLRSVSYTHLVELEEAGLILVDIDSAVVAVVVDGKGAHSAIQCVHHVHGVLDVYKRQLFLLDTLPGVDIIVFARKMTNSQFCGHSQSTFYSGGFS